VGVGGGEIGFLPSGRIVFPNKRFAIIAPRAPNGSGSEGTLWRPHRPLARVNRVNGISRYAAAFFWPKRDSGPDVVEKTKPTRFTGALSVLRVA